MTDLLVRLPWHGYGGGIHDEDVVARTGAVPIALEVCCSAGARCTAWTGHWSRLRWT